MDLPKFLLGDNSDFREDVFIIHTEFPRFILNLKDDEVTWLEEFEKEDINVLKEESKNLILEAMAFYDREIDKYNKDV